MAKKLTLKDLIKEIKELKEEIKRSKQIIVQPYPIYPLPHLCQPCTRPHYPQPVYPQWPYVYGTVSTTGSTLGQVATGTAYYSTSSSTLPNGNSKS